MGRRGVASFRSSREDAAVGEEGSEFGLLLGQSDLRGAHLAQRGTSAGPVCPVGLEDLSGSSQSGQMSDLAPLLVLAVDIRGFLYLI